MHPRNGDRSPGSVTLDRPGDTTAEWGRSPATTKRAQVRGVLEQLIDAELRSGDAIPSERALVSRLWGRPGRQPNVCRWHPRRV